MLREKKTRERGKVCLPTSHYRERHREGEGGRERDRERGILRAESAPTNSTLNHLEPTTCGAQQIASTDFMEPEMTTAACEEEHCVSLSDWLSAGKHGAQNRAHISRLDGEWISSFINGETGESGGVMIK